MFAEGWKTAVIGFGVHQAMTFWPGLPSLSFFGIRGIRDIRG